MVYRQRVTEFHVHYISRLHVSSLIIRLWQTVLRARKAAKKEEEKGSISLSKEAKAHPGRTPGYETVRQFHRLKVVTLRYTRQLVVCVILASLPCALYSPAFSISKRVVGWVGIRTRVPGQGTIARIFQLSTCGPFANYTTPENPA